MTAPLRAGDPIVVDVALGARSYDILIGRGLLATLGARIATLRPGAAAAIVTDETVAQHHLDAAEAALARRRHPARRDRACRRARARRASRMLEIVCDELLERAHRAQRRRDRARRRRGRRSRRASPPRSCGAASTSCRCRPRCWRRSIPRSAARPASIPATARTWSARSISRAWCSPTPRCSTRCRSASSAPAMPRSRNTACSATPRFFAWLEANWQRRVRRRARRASTRSPSRCRAKAAIVARDERETGDRALLNLGHTFGHALEAAAGFSDRLLHGEASSLGMALRLRVLGAARPLASAEAERVVAHLAAVGLPTHIAQIPGGGPTPTR